jgi:hypothetical protein
MPSCFSDAELFLTVQLVPKGFPLDERHHVIQEPVCLTGIEQGQDVRVLEARGGRDLVDEAFGSEHGGQFGLQHLERHLALVLEIFGEIDRGHATGSQLALQAVAVSKSCSETVQLL